MENRWTRWRGDDLVVDEPRAASLKDRDALPRCICGSGRHNHGVPPKEISDRRQPPAFGVVVASELAYVEVCGEERLAHVSEREVRNALKLKLEPDKCPRRRWWPDRVIGDSAERLLGNPA
jgi:hypothetical protein